jgi:PAS domain S-box-containing protein
MPSSKIANPEQQLVCEVQERFKSEGLEALRFMSYGLERAPDGAFWLGEDGRLVYVNHAAGESLGYTRDELLGLHISEFAPRVAREGWRAILEEIKTTPRVPYETVHRRKDGSLLPIELNATCVEFEGRAYVLGFTRDLTERKRSELALKQTEQRFREHLEALVRDRSGQLEAARSELLRRERLATIGQITATVSHELRNPLATIRASLFAIRERTRGRVAGVEAALDRAGRNLERCGQIIGDLLDFSRSRALHVERFALDSWLDRALDELAVPKGVTLVRELRSDVEARFDAERLRRCLINVFDNAVDALAGRPGPRVVTVRTRAAIDRVEVEVADNGVGISGENLPRMFEPLYSTKTFGVGLGLAMVRRILREHGGEVELESALGCGTSLTMWLPRRPGENEG